MDFRFLFFQYLLKVPQGKKEFEKSSGSSSSPFSSS